MSKGQAQEAVETFVNAREWVKKAAKELGPRQYTPETCPLNNIANDHRELSQALWGCGCWRWTCQFCGEEYTE